MSARLPLVSVVIPSYNHERFVAQAIESVFAQSYARIELIIVDDGSKDESLSVIRKTLKRRPKGFEARVIAQKNSGAHAAISFGLNQAHGQYLTILNSDDYYHPERIATLVAEARNSESELFFTMIDMVSESGERLSGAVREVLWYHEAVSLRHYLPTLGFALIRDNLAVTTGNLFFTRSLFQRVGAFRDFRYVHDVDFILRALPHTEPRLVSRKLLSYRLHGSNTIRSSNQGFEEEGRRILDEFMKAALAPGERANRFAPCPAYWPYYFNRFIAEQRPFFAESKIAHYLEESADLTLRPSAAGPAGMAQVDQAIPALTGVSIHLLDRAKDGADAFALYSHELADHEHGARFVVRLMPPAFPEGREPSAIALISSDMILATSTPGPVTAGQMECTFIVSAEFGSPDPRRMRFLALEEGSKHPCGVALHAGPGPALSVRLERGRVPEFEPTRMLIGNQAYEIRDAAGDGRIDRIRSGPDGSWILEGSAFDSVSGEPPTGVLLFDESTRLYTKYESRFQLRGDGLASRSGFKLQVPASELPDSGDSVLRAIAIFRRGIAFHLGRIARSGSQLSPVSASHSSDLLARMSRNATGWRLDNGGEAREWAFAPWRFGFVDLIDRGQNRMLVVGWAIEPQTGLMADAILVCAGEKPVLLSRLNLERPDIEKAHGLKSPLIAGFRVELDPSLSKEPLSVFALWPDGRATELPEFAARQAARNRALPRSADEKPQLSL